MSTGKLQLYSSLGASAWPNKKFAGYVAFYECKALVFILQLVDSRNRGSVRDPTRPDPPVIVPYELTNARPRIECVASRIARMRNQFLPQEPSSRRRRSTLLGISNSAPARLRGLLPHSDLHESVPD